MAQRRRWSQQERLYVLLVLGVAVLQFLWTLHFLRDHVTYHYETSSSKGQEALLASHRATDGPTSRVAAMPEFPQVDKLKLRFDWTSLERLSPLALRIEAHQSNCSKPLSNFRFRNRFGLGSDLHVYSQAMCNALEDGDIRVRTALPWIWLDEDTCNGVGGGGGADDNAYTAASAMTCYFPDSELRCPADRTLTPLQESRLLNMTRGRGKIKNACPTVTMEYSGVSDVRAATTEFLFTRVSLAVQREAERQLRHVFFGADDNNKSNGGVVPADLITVHIRWGDKAAEMKLLPVSDYIDAVEGILEQRRRSDNPEWNHAGVVNILLATEDPRALEAFQAAAPSHWKIYVDQYFREMLPYRKADTVYNGSPLMSQELAGRPGLTALGSLLVAMEANDFVLTTASNWSRLMNELRRNVLDPRCHNCTRLIDLKYGEW